MNIFLAGPEMFTLNSIDLLSLLIPVTFLAINKAENADDVLPFVFMDMQAYHAYYACKATKMLKSTGGIHPIFNL